MQEQLRVDGFYLPLETGKSFWSRGFESCRRTGRENDTADSGLHVLESGGLDGFHGRKPRAPAIFIAIFLCVLLSNTSA